MSSLTPRVVLVTRPTELAALLGHHGTRGQVEFFLSSRGQSFDEVARRDALQEEAIARAKRAVPSDWSFAHVWRDDLNRFLFFPNDIVVGLGQDGLVANLAKYLDGQPVLGISPDLASSEGVLARHGLDDLGGLLLRVAAADMDVSARSMVQAASSNGDNLLALNELFIGHRSHQSARYELNYNGKSEYQSSSGLIVSTGTGLTGWAKSIMAATHLEFELAADDPLAVFFAREPWPSRTSGAELRAGVINDQHGMQVISRNNDGGVIFADGIEPDFLRFDWGTSVEVRVADQRFNLVV